jgi:hypothetical protein
MKGKFLHNNIIAATLVKALRLRGHRVHLEHPINRGQHSRAVDIYFQSNGHWVAIEIECTTARIRNDIAKADALRPDLFLIVSPNARTAHAARAAVNRLTNGTASASLIRVMPFGTALQWIANNCPVIVRAQ